MVGLLFLMAVSSMAVPSAHGAAMPSAYPIYAGNITLTWVYSVNPANITTYNGEPLLSWEVCPRSIVPWQTEVSYWYNASPLVPTAAANNHQWILTYGSNATEGYTAQNTFQNTWQENDFGTVNSQIVNYTGYQFKVPDLVSFNLTELSASNAPMASWLASAYVQFAPCFSDSIQLSNATPMAGQNIWANVSFSGGFAPIAWTWDINGANPCGVNVTDCQFAAVSGLNNITLRSHDAASFRDDDNDRNITRYLNATSTPLSARLTVPATTTDVGRWTQATVTASGGLSPYAYGWTLNGTSLPNTTSSIEVKATTPGVHPIDATVTDATSHSTTVASNLTFVPDPIATLKASAQNVTPGTLVNLTSGVTGGTAPYAWRWTLNNTTIPDAQPYLDYVPKGASTYDFAITVTDADGMASSAHTVLRCVATPLPLHAAISSGPNVTEVGLHPQYVLTISGGVMPYSVQWSSTAGSIVGNVTGASFTPMQNGTIVAWVNDSKGAAVALAMDITVHPKLQVSGPKGYSMPLGQSLLLWVSMDGGLAPYTYHWTEGGVGVGSGPSYDFVPTAVGNVSFTLQVTDILGMTATYDVMVDVVLPSQYKAPILTDDPSWLSTDSGTNVSFNLSVRYGTAPYTLSLPSATVCTPTSIVAWTCVVAPPIVTIPQQQNLTLSVRDAYGYSDNTTVKLNVSPPLTISVTENGGRATVHGSGGRPPYIVHWILPSGVTSSNLTVPMTVGSWRVTVTDANGVTVRQNGTWAVPPPNAPHDIHFEVLLLALGSFLSGCILLLLWHRHRSARKQKEHPKVTGDVGPFDIERLIPAPKVPEDALHFIDPVAVTPTVAKIEEWDESHEPEPKAMGGPMAWLNTPMDVKPTETPTPKEMECPSCHHKARTVSETCPECFAYYIPPKGPMWKPVPRTKVEVVRTIGERRSEENPFGDSVRPEDVNPNVVHLDPQLLQPMELEVRQDRGVQSKPNTTSPEDPETKARRLMDMARRAKPDNP